MKINKQNSLFRCFSLVGSFSSSLIFLSLLTENINCLADKNNIDPVVLQLSSRNIELLLQFSNDCQLNFFYKPVITAEQYKKKLT